MDEKNSNTLVSDTRFKPTIGNKINYWWYWNIKRRSGNIGLRIVLMLPKRVVYWCVVRAAIEVEPNYNPSNVTAEEMLKRFNYRGAP